MSPHGYDREGSYCRISVGVKSKSGKRPGHVYVLVSKACKYIKIGGTDYAPFRRIREINADEPYKRLGPWSLHDFRQVADWRKVESAMLYAFRSKLVRWVEGQKELFAVSPARASKYLEQIDESLLVGKPKVDRAFQDEGFSDFLIDLFRTTALSNWLDLQGIWTLNLFPSTAGGRYYTINIGLHEVAFTSLPAPGSAPFHMILMDRLVRDHNVVSSWIRKRGGYFRNDRYASALPRSTSVFFYGRFEEAREFLDLPGVRRAIIAYWTEALLKRQESGGLSLFARYHSWNGVAELRKRISSIE